MHACILGACMSGTHSLNSWLRSRRHAIYTNLCKCEGSMMQHSMVEADWQKDSSRKGVAASGKHTPISASVSAGIRANYTQQQEDCVQPVVDFWQWCRLWLPQPSGPLHRKRTTSQPECVKQKLCGTSNRACQTASVQL